MKTLHHMDHWFSRPPGSCLLRLEHQNIDSLLSRIPGDSVIQIGGPSDLSLVQACQHPFKCYYSFSGETTPPIPSIRGNLEQLPLQAECLDLIVVAHAIAFSSSPQAFLQQLYYSLAPGGLMLILGFNPLSLFGLKRSRQNKTHFPFSGQYHLPWKVKLWLRQTHFSLIAYRTFGFYLPSQATESSRRERFSETLGQLLLSGCGSIYMILAQKVCPGMTPLQQDWWQQPAAIDNGLKPTACDTINNKGTAR